MTSKAKIKIGIPKEYFAEGLLLKAKDEFVNYFYEKTSELLYK